MNANNFGVEDTEGSNGPNSELDIYDRVTRPGANDGFLSDTNLGLGYYKDSEVWQQLERYEDGLFANSTFGRLIFERARYRAKRQLGIHGCQYRQEDGETIVYGGWEDLDEEDRVSESRREYIQERGEEIWRALPAEAQLDALDEYSGIGEDWVPPHWKVLQAQHEASRSRDARLMDNVFGRVKKILGDSRKAERSRARALLGRGDDR